MRARKYLQLVCRLNFIRSTTVYIECNSKQAELSFPATETQLLLMIMKPYVYLLSFAIIVLNNLGEVMPFCSNLLGHRSIASDAAC